MTIANIGSIANQYNVNSAILQFEAMTSGLSSPSEIGSLAQANANTLAQNGGSYTQLMQNYLQSTGTGSYSADQTNDIIGSILSGNYTSLTGNLANNNSGDIGSDLISNGYGSGSGNGQSGVSSGTTGNATSTDTPGKYDFVGQAVTAIKKYSLSLVAIIIGVVLVIGAFEVYKKS